MCEENKSDNRQCLRDILPPRANLVVLQKIAAEIEAKRNTPQELWVLLRELAVTDMATVPLGLLHDVIEFCLVVFDSLEPNITPDERNRRVAHAEGLAVGLNIRVVATCKGLSERDNAFLVKWTAITTTTIAVTRQANSDIVSTLGMFVSFPIEMQQVDHGEEVLTVCLYWLYSTIFLTAYGRIPAGVMGLASLGIGLAVREAKGMV